MLPWVGTRSRRDLQRAKFTYLFYTLAGSGRRDRLILLRLLLRVHSEVEKIVHWMPEILLAAEIAFRRLDGCVPQQELNLLKLHAEATSDAVSSWLETLKIRVLKTLASAV